MSENEYIEEELIKSNESIKNSDVIREFNNQIKANKTKIREINEHLNATPSNYRNSNSYLKDKEEGENTIEQLKKENQKLKNKINKLKILEKQVKELERQKTNSREIHLPFKSNPDVNSEFELQQKKFDDKVENIEREINLLKFVEEDHTIESNGPDYPDEFNQQTIKILNEKIKEALKNRNKIITDYRNLSGPTNDDGSKREPSIEDYNKTKAELKEVDFYITKLYDEINNVLSNKEPTPGLGVDARKQAAIQIKDSKIKKGAINDVAVAFTKLIRSPFWFVSKTLKWTATKPDQWIDKKANEKDNNENYIIQDKKDRHFLHFMRGITTIPLRVVRVPFLAIDKGLEWVQNKITESTSESDQQLNFYKDYLEKLESNNNVSNVNNVNQPYLTNDKKASINNRIENAEEDTIKAVHTTESTQETQEQTAVDQEQTTETPTTIGGILSGFQQAWEVAKQGLEIAKREGAIFNNGGKITSNASKKGVRI